MRVSLFSGIMDIAFGGDNGFDTSVNAGVRVFDAAKPFLGLCASFTSFIFVRRKLTCFRVYACRTESADEDEPSTLLTSGRTRS